MSFLHLRRFPVPGRDRGPGALTVQETEIYWAETWFRPLPPWGQVQASRERAEKATEAAGPETSARRSLLRVDRLEAGTTQQ